MQEVIEKENNIIRREALTIPLYDANGLEAQEHNYSTPRNYYWYYVNIPLEKIAPQVKEASA
jgi:hypothetical protein